MDNVYNRYCKEEMTIKTLQKALDSGEVTSKELVMYYLWRIACFDQDGPCINSILEINPDALFIAEGLDIERKEKGARSQLHGIPVLLKDNIETGDYMHTSAGTLALEQYVSAADAFLVGKLRQAGAVILGKTNMTELSNGMSSGMWAGYSSRGGQVLNPYGDAALFVGGSSSGSAAAVAAHFSVVSVGTETDGSILSPAIQNSVVGIKPTIGLISRRGIIPFTFSQDTPGPLARNVEDAALLLDILAGHDPQDAATSKIAGKKLSRFSDFLDPLGLKEARIGVFLDASNMFYQSDEYDEVLFEHAIQAIKEAGAVLIEGVEIPSFHRNWSHNVSLYELKHSLEHFLSSLPNHLPVHSLRELIQFNVDNESKALKYGQDKLEQRAALSDTLRNPAYLKARLDDLHYSQNQGIDYTMRKYNLDAILFPSYIGSTISAKAGYPSIAVPAGYKKNGKPFGVTFAGAAFSEGNLIKIAYSFEQWTQCRRPPSFSY
ncbi:amidase family protein [Bacillus sp. 1P06AnD]|uniref:amidase family protein n=1 Tax=Bacillus sp. 1P06AnD TaxID=3132208 RepID=UPI0039A1C296